MEGKTSLKAVDINSRMSKSQSVEVKKNLNGTFTCLKCDKNFTTKSAAVRHYRNHTGNHPYVCSLCQEIFASKASLSTHELRVHNLHQEVALSCGDCGKLFMRRNALDVHLKIHSAEKSFQCDHCGKCFTQKISRDVHQAIHTGKYDYQCSICLKVFASQAKLNSHKYIHQTPRFTCELCGVCFVRQDSLRGHQRTHTRILPFQCCVCSLSFTSLTKLLTHKQIHNEINCKCSLCSTQSKHARIETISQKPHVNEICSDSLEDNVGDQHNEENINCLEQKNQSGVISEDSLQSCFMGMQNKNEVYQKKDSESREVDTIKDKVHTCHFCPKRYVQKNKLADHIKTHLQEPAHECSLCGKRFYRKDVFNRHLLLHGRERPFSCAHCGRTFASKYSLLTHLKTHTPNRVTAHVSDFQCKDCGKKFKNKNTFVLHRRTHLGDFNHTCMTCGKKFMKKSHFEGHMRSHCSDRPFQCATCGRRFKERKHCQEHGRKSHSNTLNLASLFASISNDNAQMDPMNDIMFSSAQSLPQEEIMSSLDVPEISQELQSALICPVPDSSVSPQLDTAYLSPPVHLNEASLVISTPLSSLVFSNLGETLEEIQSPSVNQFFMTDENPDISKTNSYQLNVQNNDLSFTILSGEETSSVLSQGLQ